MKSALESLEEEDITVTFLRQAMLLFRRVGMLPQASADACYEYCWYNFGRSHKSLRMTPAMAAGISDLIWSVREILEAA